MKVLIVEDQIGQVMERILKHTFPDAEVKLVLNGVEGLHAFREFKPDLIISDWNMPRMHGGRMAEKIRAENPNQKIILWSASFYKDFLGYTQHFNQIVDKDIGWMTMKEVIQGVMDEGLESTEQSG